MTKDEEANIGFALFGFDTTELDEYRRRFREAVKINKDIEALENETHDKAKMLDDKGEYNAAAEFYLLVEEINKALGKSISFCNYARESAADASSKAKNWGYAGMLYRGVVYSFTKKQMGSMVDPMLLISQDSSGHKSLRIKIKNQKKY